ncbi:hypothetical protein HY448_01585 [Candidatus Pacearchaeota archaeon]|nr:hypothetical protein [Candidatus Pacearchaeota archaeon]
MLDSKNLTGLRVFYDSFKDRYGTNLESCGINGHYTFRSLPLDVDRGLIPDGEWILEIGFVSADLSAPRNSRVQLWYMFPQPMNDKKLIKGLQRTAKMIERLEKKGWSEKTFEYGGTHKGNVLYSIDKKVSNERDVARVFQEVSALEDLMKRPLD